MEEPVWISHIQDIALDDFWVTVTDVMSRQYRIDPQAAMTLAVWIAEHYQDVAQAQVNLLAEWRIEEARLYGPLLGSVQVQPKEDQVVLPGPASSSSPPKRRHRPVRKKEDI